jgi:hypothetical protein
MTLQRIAQTLACNIGDLFLKAQIPLPLENQWLMERPKVRDWLRGEGHMTGESLLSWTVDLDLDISREGFPVGIECAIHELRQVCDHLVIILKTYPARDAPFPGRQGLPDEETVKALHKEARAAWQVGWEILDEYVVYEGVTISNRSL